MQWFCLGLARISVAVCGPGPHEKRTWFGLGPCNNMYCCFLFSFFFFCCACSADLARTGSGVAVSQNRKGYSFSLQRWKSCCSPSERPGLTSSVSPRACRHASDLFPASSGSRNCHCCCLLAAAVAAAAAPAPAPVTPGCKKGWGEWRAKARCRWLAAARCACAHAGRVGAGDARRPRPASHHRFGAGKAFSNGALYLLPPPYRRQCPPNAPTAPSKCSPYVR